MMPANPGPTSFRQCAVARYGRFGFEAAAVTYGVVASAALAEPEPVTVPRRTATLYFDRPYAVVATTWDGLTIFGLWVATANESEDG